MLSELIEKLRAAVVGVGAVATSRQDGFSKTMLRASLAAEGLTSPPEIRPK